METAPECVKCGAVMIKREGKFGPFWSCPNWRSNGKGCDAKPINISAPKKTSIPAKSDKHEEIMKALRSIYQVLLEIKNK